VTKRIPDWASDVDQEVLDEIGREDQWLRDIEAGETPPPVRITRERSTVKEVAERHGLSDKTIRKYVHDGALKAEATNPDAPPKQRRWRIHRDDELAWIEARKADVRTAAKTRTNTSRPTRTFRERVK
jgi:excisionase family DNA binding protein